MVVPQFPKNMPSRFYYTNDGTDIRYNRNIYAGDLLRETNVKKFFEERTHADDELRRWCMGGEADKVDESGKVVMHLSGSVREYYRQLKDDSKRPSFTENQESWTKYAPPGHYTTDADYERMKEIWDQEKIMGDDTPCWEDVPVGFELPQDLLGRTGDLHAHDVLVRHWRSVHLLPGGADGPGHAGGDLPRPLRRVPG